MQRTQGPTTPDDEPYPGLACPGCGAIGFEPCAKECDEQTIAAGYDPLELEPFECFDDDADWVYEP